MKEKDFLYLGLGAGALYLLYKSGKGVSSAVGGAGEAIGGISTALARPVEGIGNFYGNIWDYLGGLIPKAGEGLPSIRGKQPISKTWLNPNFVPTRQTDVSFVPVNPSQRREWELDQARIALGGRPTHSWAPVPSSSKKVSPPKAPVAVSLPSTPKKTIKTDSKQPPKTPTIYPSGKLPSKVYGVNIRR